MAFKTDTDKTGLEETTITQLKDPLDDRERQPMPPGGLFSTAGDLARFDQMILNRDVSQGKRYLSEAAVAEMTRKQPGVAIKESDDLVWATAGGSIGHGGASATTMTIDLKRGLILVFLVRHAAFPGDGGKSQAAFKKAAEEQFGHPR